MRITAGTVAWCPVRRVVAFLTAAALLTACTGGDKQPAASSTLSTSPTPAPVIPSTKPTVTVPNGAPPAKLVVKDLIVGTGDFAEPGKTVSVNYVGVHFDSGAEFDSSWRSGHPFAFQLGAEDVIAGWDEGVVGMRVGGRRELIIPPDLGYGPNGDQSGVIKPNETLVFVVDLVSVGGRVAGPGNPPPST